MRRVLAAARNGHLMRAPKTFDFLAVDLFRAGPALGAAQHDHRPVRPLGAFAAVAGVLLDRSDAGERDIERIGHGPVHQLGIVALDEQRLVTKSAKEIADLAVGHAAEHGRVRDLVAVEVQDRQHGAVMRGIEELVGVPGRRQRPGLGLAVADNAGDDQIGIVERRAIGMHQRVTELAALVDRPRRLRRRVARDAAGEGKLPEKFSQSVHIARNVRIDLAVAAFQISVRNHARAAMTGTADIEHAEILRPDDAVEMRVDEIQPRRRAPMAEQTRLDVLGPQGLAQQGIVQEIDLPDGEVVRGAPVAIEEIELAACSGRLLLICHDPADLHPGSSSTGFRRDRSVRRIKRDRGHAVLREVKGRRAKFGQRYCAWGCFRVFDCCS